MMDRLPEHLLNIFTALIVALIFTVVCHKMGVRNGITMVFFIIFVASLAILHYWMVKTPRSS